MANDKCPEWANSLIMYLRDIEVKLGNIPDSPDWQTVESVEDLQARSFPTAQTLQEDEFVDNDIADRLFERIVMKLADEDHSVDEIVSYVNSRLCYKGGPPYCDAKEVSLVLE